MSGSRPVAGAQDAADRVLINGDIHTMEAAQPRVEAMAVRGGIIIALGSNAAICACTDARTEIVDLGGRMAMPGLIDAHCHPTKGAIADLYSCKFAFSATPETIADAVRTSVARSPDAACIVGGRWGSDFFQRHTMPSPRVWLDRVAPERAVYLRDDSGHNGWANSRALALIGIGRDTPDPSGGTIVREPSGEPTGLLLEAADSFARNRLPDWSETQYRDGVLEMVRIANAYGITGVNDADANEPLLRAYQQVDRAGALSLYVAASISTPYGHRTEPLNYAGIEALRDRYVSARVDTRFVKIYEDGVPTAARTAAMLAPYVPDPAFADGYAGVLHVDEATLTRDLAELERRGFTVKLHTAGDRALRVALNAIERAHELTRRTDLRHELAHAGLVDPADIPRFKALNVVADLSPYLWYPSPIIDSIVGAVGERGQRYWPVRTLLAAGATVLAGSDWPAAVASMDPWIGIQTLVTRRDPSGARPDALWPE